MNSAYDIQNLEDVDPDSVEDNTSQTPVIQGEADMDEDEIIQDENSEVCDPDITFQFSFYLIYSLNTTPFY